MRLCGLATTAATALLLTGSVTVGDNTAGQSSVCAVHQVAMKLRRVEEGPGLKPSRYPSLIEIARTEQFPHADEPQVSGGCMASFDYVKTYVCLRCTRARQDWLAANPPGR